MNIHHGQTLFYKLEYLSLLDDSVSFMKQIWNLSVFKGTGFTLNLHATVPLTQYWGLQRKQQCRLHYGVQSYDLENAVFHLLTKRVELKMPSLPWHWIEVWN